MQIVTDMNFNKFSIFRLPNKYKRFDYTPRYYDPEKEARDKRRKELSAAAEFEDELGGKKRISFRDGQQMKSNLSQQQRASNIRLLVILIGLLALVYYVFQNLSPSDVPSNTPNL